MDPISVIASAVGIATVAAQAATTFAKAVKSIRGARTEIRAISRDVDAFYAVISSLNALLKDEEVIYTISHDAAIVSMVESLENPLQNCQSLLADIMIKMHKRCNLHGETRNRHIKSMSMRWGFCAKTEIRDLHLHLEATKSTLCGALSVLSILCNVRLLTVGNVGGSCIASRQSSTHPLCMRFSSSFDHQLASRPAEQYTTQSLFSERIFLVATKQSLEDLSTQTYFLAYAETTRLWRRVVVVARSNILAKERSTMPAVASTDKNEDTANILPSALHNLLSQELPKLPLYGSVSRLSLTLNEDENGLLSTKTSEVRVAEDLLERELMDEEEVLRDLPDMGCPTLIESEVSVESRVFSTSYNATARTCRCVERKAPFASAGNDGDNGFKDFLHDLKLSIALRDCPGVAKFMGAVLDDTRSHLKSYLHERPAIPSLGRLFTIANAESEKIPWAAREMWAKQIVSAVSEIHRRGLSLGTLWITSVAVKADGAAILTRLQNSQRLTRNEKGWLPPEMRENLRNRDSSQQCHPINYRTDIFQLGFILWLLAEHKSNPAGYLCARAVCTAFPSFKCTAEHANPIELPPCSGDVPAYFADVVRRCRSPDPRARPPAQELLETFRPTRESPPDLQDLVDSFARRVTYFWTNCDSCGRECRNLHYHCSACYGGNFDICSTCFEARSHCFNSEHRLRKIVFRNERFVDET